jgi:nucleotide-binding universal stress UspA family protein
LAVRQRPGVDLIVSGRRHARRTGQLALCGVPDDLIEATTIPALVISDEQAQSRAWPCSRRACPS